VYLNLENSSMCPLNPTPPGCPTTPCFCSRKDLLSLPLHLAVDEVVMRRYLAEPM